MIKLRPKIAITYKGNAYAYQEVLQYSYLYGAFFASNNQPKRVLIFAENSPEWVFAFYGAIRNHAIVIPVDVQSTAKELAYMVNDSQPDIIFTSEERKKLVTGILPELSYEPKIFTPSDIPVGEVHTAPYDEIPVGEPDETVLIIYTSGTTGSPKGVMLSYKNIMYNINAVSISVPIYKESSSVMILLPLHHAFPLMGSLICPLYVGATVHIAEGLNAEAIIQTLNTGKVSIIIGVPRLYDMLAKGVMGKINGSFITRYLYKIIKVLGSDRLSKLVFKKVHDYFGGAIEFLVSGGAALSDETAAIFKALGFYVLEGYGMTETAPMISFTRPGGRKIGYTGHPLPGIEVKIADNGEVCVRGDNVMQGYYHRPDETAQIIRDGWLHTGDIGFLNKHGLKLTGRLKDIIVTPNGKNINPEEIEEELVNISPLIKEAGIFMNNGALNAIIYPDMQEVRQLSGSFEEEMKAAIMAFNNSVAPYRRLKRYHLVGEELPKTRLGKIQRFKLPELLEKTAKAEEEENLSEKSRIYLTLKEFIEEETGMHAGGDDHFEIDLSMDSLGRVSLLAFVENTFWVPLKEEDLERLNTLNKLSEFIESQSQSIYVQKTSWKEILSERIHIKLPKPGLTNWFLHTLGKIVFHCLYRLRIKGKENFSTEPCLIVGNHRSALDGVIITAFMKQKVSKRTYFFAKDKYWTSAFARFIARKNNVILMNINKNVKAALQQMNAVLKGGNNVIIFPEGTRSYTKEIQKFKESFAILSCEANVPIVPVIIDGSEKLWLKRVRLPRLFTKIRVNILKAVDPQQFEDSRALCRHVENLMRDELKKME